MTQAIFEMSNDAFLLSFHQTYLFKTKVLLAPLFKIKHLGYMQMKTIWKLCILKLGVTVPVPSN